MHFAKIENGIVTQVIVAEQDVVSSLDGIWVQTSYNTRAGEHLLGGTPLRKNYAGIGYVYDEVRDAFYEQRPSLMHQLNEDACTWELKPEFSGLRYVYAVETGEVPAAAPVGGEGYSALFLECVRPGVYQSVDGEFVFVDAEGVPVKVIGSEPNDIYRFVGGLWVAETVTE